MLGLSFPPIERDTGRERFILSHCQLQFQLFSNEVPLEGVLCTATPFSSASVDVTMEIVTKRVKATRMRARRVTDATRESSKLETLGNLLATRPDIVASITSRVGILMSSSSS